MFAATDTAWAPWFVARSEEEARAPEYHYASAVADPYKSVHTEPVKLPKRKIGKVKTADYPFRFIAERF
jgi:hypothetical protein